MALSFSDLFDFDGYNKAIKENDALNKAWAKNIVDYNKQIAASYDIVKADLKEYASMLKDLSIGSRGASSRIKEIGEETERLSTRFNNQKAAMQALSDVQDIVVLSTKELKLAAKGIQAEYDSLRGDTAELIAKKATLAKQFQDVTAAIKMQSSALKATTPEIKAAADSYYGLQSELSEVGKTLKSMSNAFDPVTGKINENNKEAVALQKRYIDLNGTLKNVDAGLGNFHRNIGNYKSGFAGLGNSINQITREFPAFSNSVQTGFLAISNNLPIFFDEIKGVNAQLKEMKAQGQQVPSLLDALGKSFLTLNTLLSLGVTLLTVYGKDIVEFVEKIFKAKEVFNSTAESIKFLNKAVGESSVKKAVADVYELQAAVNLAKEGFANKDDVVRHYNDTLGKTIGEVKTLDEVEKSLADNADNYIRFTLLKAAANLALEEAASKALEIEKKRQLLPAAPVRVNEGKLAPTGVVETAAGNDLEQQRQALVKKAEKELTEDQKAVDGLKKIAEKFLGDAAQKGFSLFGTKPDKGAENKALSDYEKLLREREALLKKNLDEAIILAQGQRDRDEISEVEFQDKKFQASQKYAKLATAEETAANKVGYKAKKSLLEEFDNVRLKAEQDFNNIIVKIGKDHDLQVLENRKKAIEDLAVIETNAVKDQQVRELSNQRLTNEERVTLEIDYQNKIDEIQIQSLNDRAALEIDQAKKRALKAQAALLGSGIEKRTAFGNDITIPRARLADNEKDLNAELQRRRTFGILTVQYEIQVAEKLLAIRKKLNLDTTADEAKLLELRKRAQDEIVNTLKDSSRIVGGIIGQEFANSFDLLLDGVQKLANGGKLAFQDYAEFAGSLANGITANYKANLDQQLSDLEAQKNAELKIVGNNQSAQDAINKKYAKEEAMLKRKQAKADRDNAVFQVLINTSQAVAKSIADSPLTFGLPWSAYAAAAGALQVALVLSRPLPAYEKGTQHSQEGLALVGEKGTEMVIDKSGKLRLVGEQGPELTYLQGGSQVKTATETKRIMQNIETDRIIREALLGGRLSESIRSAKQFDVIDSMSKAMERAGIHDNNMQAELLHAVKNIAIHQTILDERGYHRAIKQGGRTTHLLNQYKLSK